jgi:regulator of sirC expression with transglutaminase-like and TPR domain
MLTRSCIMPCRRLLLCAGWILLSAKALAPAEEPKAPASPAGAMSVQQVAERARPSVVVITSPGRDGKRQGLGTGFVVGADGLIATNLHVIGEGRPIAVQLANGKRYDALAIYASDRSLDLALIRVGVRDLVPLELGDSEGLKEGQPVVALGNPHGLTHSVVSGVVSGRRDIDGRKMIQIAIPIEQGNSGGPLLDLHGRVHGILTMKSLVTANLGFAVPVNTLKPLLAKPNPIPITRWLTLDALDKEEWTPLLGARWRRRGDRILVDGLGSGFGGRSLCLSERPLPGLPYEVAVAVRLEDEKGAAGLIFHADGGDKHYGFYPSGGQLRLTRFDGPDVFSWKILSQEASPHYRPGEWNLLKVRVEKDRLCCYVNGHLVVECTDDGFREGKVGLAKFRDTRAEFRHFQAAREITPHRLPPELLARITRSLDGLSPQAPPRAELVESLLPEAAASMTVLRERAKRLEQEAVQLRDLAALVHRKRVQADLVKALDKPEDDIDLLHASLLLAKLDNDELDPEAYRKEVDRMARELSDQFPKNADEKARLAALTRYLFSERGFHGSRADYYNRANSYLNEVIDDREGLPITLSVLHMELARRIGLKVVGISLPGHFVVQHVPAQGEPQLLDVFEGGQPLTREEAEQKVRAITGRPLREEHLHPVTKRAIVLRMLHNLLGVARGDGDARSMLRYLDILLALSADAAPERWLRGVLRFRTGDRPGALEDVEWLLEHRPAGVNHDEVLELRRLLTRPER